MEKTRSKEERSEWYREHYYSFTDRLVLKVVGRRSFILRFLKDLHKLYPAMAMNVSPIKGDNVNPTQSVFINIFFDVIDKQSETKPSTNEPNKEER